MQWLVKAVSTNGSHLSKNSGKNIIIEIQNSDSNFRAMFAPTPAPQDATVWAAKSNATATTGPCVTTSTANATAYPASKETR